MRDSFYGPPPPTLMQGPIPFQPTITLAGAAAAKGPIPKLKCISFLVDSRLRTTNNDKVCKVDKGKKIT